MRTLHHLKGQPCSGLFFDTILSSTKASFPLITLLFSSSNRSARILFFFLQKIPNFLMIVTCMDFPRQHRRRLRRTPRLPHSSAKVHIRLSVKPFNFSDIAFFLKIMILTVGYPLLKNMARSELHLMGEISAVRGHFPGAQSGRPSDRLKFHLTD